MNFAYTFFNSFLRTLARIICYLVFGMLLCVILSKFGFKLFSDVYANTFIPEYYNIRGGGYGGTLMASSLSNASGIYTCSNNSYCTMTIEAFLDTDINYNNQSILTTLDVCSGVNNFPHHFDSSRNDTVFDGDTVSYQTIGTCKIYNQTVLRQRVKISWTPKYNLADGYSNVTLLSMWSSFNDYGSDVAFQILSVKNDIYTPDMQAQDELNKQNDIIINQNDTIINNQGNIKNGIDDIKSDINSDNVDDPSSSINSFKDKIATNGVITQLVGLPVTLFTKVLNSVNGTCSSYNLGSLFGTDLVLPCVNIETYLGSTLWNIIDVLISGLFVYTISKKFIKVFENMSSMNEGDVIGD